MSACLNSNLDWGCSQMTDDDIITALGQHSACRCSTCSCVETFRQIDWSLSGALQNSGALFQGWETLQKIGSKLGRAAISQIWIWIELIQWTLVLTLYITPECLIIDSVIWKSISQENLQLTLKSEDNSLSIIMFFCVQFFVSAPHFNYVIDWY